MKNHDVWTDRLSDWLDGELDEREHAAVSAHLEGCAACRDVADELAEVRGRARLLADVEPEDDLWAGIEARLGEEPKGDLVIDLTRHLEPGARAAGPVGTQVQRARRGVFLGMPQIAAAAVVLLLGGWAVGVTGGGLPEESASIGAVAQPAVVLQASDLLGDRALAEGMGELQRLFDERTDRLSPEIRARLERNLALIDRAIAESIEALHAEPASPYLRDHLVSGLDRRRTALESAVRLLERTS